MTTYRVQPRSQFLSHTPPTPQKQLDKRRYKNTKTDKSLFKTTSMTHHSDAPRTQNGELRKYQTAYWHHVVSYLNFYFCIYSPGQMFPVTRKNVSGQMFPVICVYVRLNTSATNIGQNKTHYVYFKIFNQIELRRHVCLKCI